jgi:hypothetical protein
LQSPLNILIKKTPPPYCLIEKTIYEKREEEEEEEEQTVDKAFIPPLLIAPAVITQSKADRKRASIIKTLEAK